MRPLNNFRVAVIGKIPIPIFWLPVPFATRQLAVLVNFKRFFIYSLQRKHFLIVTVVRAQFMNPERQFYNLNLYIILFRCDILTRVLIQRFEAGRVASPAPCLGHLLLNTQYLSCSPNVQQKSAPIIIGN